MLMVRHELHPTSLAIIHDLFSLKGSLQLVYIASTNCLVTQHLTIVSAYERQARRQSFTSSPTHSQEDSKSLMIPNPFKAFGMKSAESIGLLGQSHGSVTEQLSQPNTVTSDVGRVRLEEEESRGIVTSSPGFSLEGFTTCYAGLNERIVGLAWSSTEVMVRFGYHHIQPKLDNSFQGIHSRA